MLIFTSEKIQRLRPGLNPQTWVPEASMLTTRPPKPSTNGMVGERYGNGMGAARAQHAMCESAISQ